MLGAEVLTNNISLVPLTKPSERIQVNYTDNNFQAIPYELGFMNRRNLDCVYITRSPVRHSKVGIDVDNLQSMKVSSRQVSNLPSSVVTSQDFEDMIFNKYPLFEQAMKIVKKTTKDGGGVAFNKYFALFNILDDEDEPQTCLYHMGMTRLGRLNKETGKFDTNNRSRKHMLAMLAKTGMIPHEYV